MKRLLIAALAAALTACMSKGCGAGPAPTPSAPEPAVHTGSGWNVLLLTIDTLRPDHLGLYGYGRDTSPHIDAFARQATVFEQAYTFWPKTRGSFAMMVTGRTPSQNGYSKKHPLVLGFNATIASVLQKEGYATTAVVDNPNVAAQYGYNKGFDSYRETWTEKSLSNEMDRTRAITSAAEQFLRAPPAGRPYFLWLHYVNPHGPYEPPAPFDTKFVDAEAAGGPELKTVDGFHGGVRREWARPGVRRLGQYVALYDGEIATVDAEVGRVLAALDASGQRGQTIVILTSDHGESLGEHGYYFDHGENLFDPCLRVPLLVSIPGGRGARAEGLVSTLDLMPTILDAAKVSYPPGLAGQSVLAVVEGRPEEARARLYAQNERNLNATFDGRFKLVATPGTSGHAYALYDRQQDAGETRDASPKRPEELRIFRREQELFFERAEHEWSTTRPLVGDAQGEPKPTADACEQLKALGYVGRCP